jgi:AmiR/NasT family two-component response regulator
MSRTTVLLQANRGDMTDAGLALAANSLALTASAIPTVMFDRELRVRGLNPAYEQVSLRPGAALLGEEVFVAFPDNPADPAGAGGGRLMTSLEHVLRRRERHHLGLIRYDISDPRQPEVYLPRVWSAVNSPILEDGRVIGVMEQVEDVTALTYDVAADLPLGDEPLNRLVLALVNATATLRAVMNENDQLRDGLATNRVIGVAIGIVMAQYNLSRASALEFLRLRSQRSNQKLRAIAEMIADSGAVPPA